MAKDRSTPLQEVTFRCKSCKRDFSSLPERTEPAPDVPHHPYSYFCPCPDCGEESAQAFWEKNLIKGWHNATGPKTAEGIAASSANLDGHPTPEEALRTRFNAMKHGLSARAATYFPPKPDGYDFCSGCDVDREYCRAQPACVKKTELFMLHHAAFEQRNPKHLMGIYADLQASVFAVLQQILQTLIADGVKIESPKYYVDKNDTLIVAEYLDENGQRRIIKDINAHPLFKPLGEMISRSNLSLADMGMTVKVIEDEEQGMGRLKQEGEAVESLSDYQRRTAAALENLVAKVGRAKIQTESDPLLLEFNQENGQHTEVQQ
ncbi:MAG: hypothetical protein LLG15_07625 [Betaproteobacteria bacterium]|nr:hypothetical protein [Betaproteobacteria bacterium]